MEIVAQLPSSFRVLNQPTRYKAFHGGRGGGKSHSVATSLLIKGTERTMRFLCLRETQRSISASVKQLLDDKIEEHKLHEFYHSTRDRITGINGTLFRFEGLRTNPAGIKSMEGIDIAWVEEAEVVSQTSLDMLIPTIRKPGSEIWFTWNRRFADDPVDALFLGGTPPPNAIIVKVGWQDNPWFPPDLMAEKDWMEKRDPEKARHIYGGELLQRSEALVFKHWVQDDLDDQISRLAKPLLGADWGYSVDPTCLVECYLLPGDKLYFSNEAYKIGCEIEEIPSLFAGSDWNDPPRWKNKFGHRGLESARSRTQIVADSARPDTISLLRGKGFNISRARKGARSVEEGIEFLQSKDIVVNPRCTHVIDELQHYSYKTDPLTDKILPELEDKDNHVIDSARYALEATRRAAGGSGAGAGPIIIVP